MNREVFRRNTGYVLLYIVVFTMIIGAIALLTTNIKILLYLFVPLFIAYIFMKPKLIIRNNMLSLEGFFKTEEISLLQVTQFITQPVTNEVIVVDSMREYQFKFPISLIADKNRRRFEESIWNVNGKIEFKVESVSPGATSQ